MTSDLWLPKGYKIDSGATIHILLFSGKEWHIYGSHDTGNILIVQPNLAIKWIDSGLVNSSLLSKFTFGDESYLSLASQIKYILEPVEDGKSPDSITDAIAFSLALKESRKYVNDASFHDAIYVEQYSRLLPTWTLTPQMDDETVLGTWIAGGVVISTNSFRRLSNLAGWMPSSALAEVVAAAGFHIPDNLSLLTKRGSESRQSSDAKSAEAEKEVRTIKAQPDKDRPEKKEFKLPGRSQLEKFFNEHVIDIIFNPDKYQALGIEFPSAIVLHGPPGCGKTFAVERLVEYIDWPNYSIDSNSVGSPYIHETSKRISEVFNKAIDEAPSVVVIDEMESFLTDRRSGGTSGLYHIEEVAEFLKRIPEAIKKRVLIIAMTNLIELIDPAILRRGRFDHIIEVGMPSRTEVASLIDSLLEKLPKSDNLALDSILDKLTGKPLSDTAFVIREAARLAAKDGKTQIDQDSIVLALKGIIKAKENSDKRIGFFRDSKS